jgi:hypothetical protein
MNSVFRSMAAFHRTTFTVTNFNHLAYAPDKCVDRDASPLRMLANPPE